ncbi:MAG: NAD-dependent epimerase/dehydratase family protein [Flavobacteriales bacterium]|nr:NAD-dependent epimerase/dehydratase family protein [Crocinitomicaceae bacterium]NBX79466.1 NAD-dependent epimerase/dehydratase family protein [Flavobacteriales bacterium]
MNLNKIIGRYEYLFQNDILKSNVELLRIIQDSTFLVIGGAGSIGQAVVKELFKRNPKKLHVVDFSENNLAELVRDLRSSIGYISGDFRTFALDIGSEIYDAFIENDGEYNYVFNLSALKHVRSEKDAFTLMRMIEVNILNTEKTILQSISKNTKKYFCVSTDKAANPVNLMGASKRIMEMFLMRQSLNIPISTARFANVAFSDGSLLHSFNQRILKNQPLVAPTDIRRYFVTPQEAGELCLMSCIYGENRDIFFPKLSEENDLITFSDIAIRYLQELGYEAVICKSEEEARESVDFYKAQKKWPCFFTISDTTGEKDAEEFYTNQETIDWSRFEKMGIIKNNPLFDNLALNEFSDFINECKHSKKWTKQAIVDSFFKLIPDLNYEDKGVYLDSKM